MRVAIMCNTKSSEYPNRPELIEDFISKGDVVFFAAIDDGVIHPYFSEGKASYLPVLASRNNTNPIVEIKSLLNVKKQVKKYRIDGAVIYGIKNHPAMAIGCRMGGVKQIVCVVNGRGNLFTAKGVKGKILRMISYPMLKIAYKCSQTVCFQNEDDAELFIQKHLVNRRKVSYSDGSGVNTDLFPFYEMPKQNDFLYLARITPSKGVKEYIEAAEILKKKYPDTRFHVVGPVDNMVEESCMSIIDKAASKGIILYHGRTDDVKGWLKSTRYFVYPSYYPEGVPRCVLQAMSCGRPIITCNSPGCKKTVIENENGYLVEPKNSEDVAERMELLICDKIQAEKMGRASRNLAETVFNVRIINKIIISLVHKEEI